MVKVRCLTPHLNVVVPVVVEVEDTVQLAVLIHVDVLRVLHSLAHRLPRILLHLDVVEFPATKTTFRLELSV
jgi:hypothetical protein